MADERSYPAEVPKLGGRKWEDARDYLEEFLRRLTGSADATNTSLTTIEQTIEQASSDDPLSARPALPHVHKAEDIRGLESPLARRAPAPHVHQPADVAGLANDTQVILASQVFGG